MRGAGSAIIKRCAISTATPARHPPYPHLHQHLILSSQPHPTHPPRAAAISTFQSPSPTSPRVLLLSLKAGGVGLNLTAASRVHILDPWWNPSVEEQAMDRVHRLGQTKAVTVRRYVARGTVEERMLALQVGGGRGGEWVIEVIESDVG